MEEITVIDFIGILAIIVLVMIIFMICIAGMVIVGVCIYKITEKIIKIIENYFNNL